MIVFCEDCGKRYRIDPSKIKKPRVTFLCKDCGHPITLSAPKKAQPESVGNKSEAKVPAEKKTEKIVAAGPVFAEREKPGMSTATRMAVVLTLALWVPLLLIFGFWLPGEERQAGPGKDIPSICGNIIDEWMEGKFNALELTAHIGIRNLMMPLSFGDFINTDLPGMAGLDPIFFLHADGRILSGTGKLWPVVETALKQNATLILDSDRHWQVVSDRDGATHFAVFYMPIRKDDKIIGYVGGGEKSRNLHKRISEWIPGKNGTILLLDEAGRPLLSGKQTEPLSPAGIPHDDAIKVSQKRSSQAVYPEVSIGGITVPAHPLRYGGSLIYIPSGSGSFFRGPSNWIGIGATALLLFFIPIFFYLYIKSALKPVTELSQAAERFSMGNVDERMPVVCGGEFGKLARSVSRIAESLRILLERMDGNNDGNS